MKYSLNLTSRKLKLAWAGILIHLLVSIGICLAAFYCYSLGEMFAVRGLLTLTTLALTSSVVTVGWCAIGCDFGEEGE